MTSEELRHICLLLRRFMSGSLSLADQTRLLSLIEIACRTEYRLSSWIQNVARRELTDFRSMVVSLCDALFDTPKRPGQLFVALNRKSEFQDAELFLYFEHVTRVLIRRQLFRRCSETNPVLFKTRHNLLQVLREEPRIFAYKHNKSTIWIALVALTDLREGGLSWTDRELLSILYKLDKGNISHQELVVCILGEVAAVMDHRAAVDFSQLVAVISQGKQEIADQSMLAHLSGEQDTPLKKVQREKAAARVIIELDLKIDCMHQSAKFDGYLGNYREGIVLLLQDLTTFGERDFHWKCLARTMPGITPAIYREKHRAFDDLAIWAKRRIIEILREY